jgi:hypothetical protein
MRIIVWAIHARNIIAISGTTWYVENVLPNVWVKT